MIVINWFVGNWLFNIGTWWVWPILALACYRWASFLVDEEGPFGIFEWMRRKRGIATLNSGAKISRTPTAFTCVKCMSVWCALWLTLLPWQVSFVFAISAFAIMWGSHI